MENFKSIYSLSCNKQGTIADNFDHKNGSGWVPILRKNLDDWEVQEMTSFLGIFEGVQAKGGCGSRIKKDIFSTKYFYKSLVVQSNVLILLNGIWISGIPSKVSFFIWNVYLDKILTLNHLKSRGWNLQIGVLYIWRRSQ